MRGKQFDLLFSRVGKHGKAISGIKSVLGQQHDKILTVERNIKQLASFSDSKLHIEMKRAVDANNKAIFELLEAQRKVKKATLDLETFEQKRKAGTIATKEDLEKYKISIFFFCVFTVLACAIMVCFHQEKGSSSGQTTPPALIR